jgi:hypothetical protein
MCCSVSSTDAPSARPSSRRVFRSILALRGLQRLRNTTATFAPKLGPPSCCQNESATSPFATRVHYRALVLAVASSAPAVSGTDVAIPYAGAARFLPNRFPDKGTAISVIHLLASGGSVTTQLVGQPPNQTWRAELYDAGTCSRIRHLVLILPRVWVGSDWRRTTRLILSTATRFAILRALATRHTLVLRLSTDDYRTCQRYFPIPGS